jgi:hypothetical protein
MAHALAQELRARGVEIPLAECEEILRRVMNAGAVASDRLLSLEARPKTQEPS